MERQLADAVVGQGAVRVDAHRIVDRPEPARPLAVALLDEARCAVRHHRHHRDIRRQHAPASPQHRHDRPVVGPVVGELQTRVGLAGEQQMGGRGVIDVVVCHRPNQGELVGAPREPRQMLADAQARHRRWDGAELAAELDRRVGLHVPGVLLRRPAPHEQEDARSCPPRRRIGLATRLQKARQTEAKQAQRPSTQELAPVDDRIEVEVAASGGHVILPRQDGK